MKNMKVAKKLITSFLIVAAFTAIVGLVGIVGMRTIDSSFDDMYTMQTVPMPELGKTVEMLQRMRACMREFIIGAAVGDMDLIEDAYNRVETYRPVMYASMEAYYATIRAPEAIRLFDEARNLYSNDFRECIDLIYNGAKSGEDPSDLYALMRQYTEATNKIVENFDICLQMKIDVAADASHNASKLADRLLVAIITVLALALGFAVFIAFYISGLISKPLLVLTAFMKKAGSTGDITLEPEEVQAINEYAQSKDELGQCIGACSTFINHVAESSKELETVASGDLTVNVKILSDRDTMGVSLKKTVDSLCNMFGEINSSTGQVSTGAKQIADSSQALASGSTQQAAAVEELSASVSDISEKTKNNAEKAGKAAELANSIKNKAETGSRQMDEMMSAVNEINQASQSINKVIKVIDDIAFQTNILALNAAVEAARAGQHGKGFAVVAEEVRNLAAKSAEAAKDTGGLIANSMEKAELGARIAQETAASLTEIVEGINESSRIVAEIATSSEEQSSAVEQINIGLNQVTQVIQQNSATAEESAAASEEMSGQSAMLEDLVAQFKLK
ncbi:MAG: methyl-accepting chemotaxis protein [Oscillospiraceae bacterium]|nr:methyl-accepting chemotaxis protein [Oscillospiraceae bacterium]